MDIKTKMTVSFTPDQVSDIIKEHLRANGYEPQGDVFFDVVNQLEGYGMNEYNVTRFREASINVVPAHKNQEEKK